MEALRYSSLYKSMCTDVSVNTFVYRSEVDCKEYRKYIFYYTSCFMKLHNHAIKAIPPPDLRVIDKL